MLLFLINWSSIQAEFGPLLTAHLFQGGIKPPDHVK